MIAIVNYGLGNISAFANIYKRLNIEVATVSSVKELEGATKIILPGVGAFDWALSRLNQSGMRDCLERLVLDEGRPVLGVCVGMQMMARKSEEGALDGLGWIDAEVKKFTSPDTGLHLPHMGWNNVSPVHSDCIFRGLEADARFYFLHSYYFSQQRDEDVLAVTDYHGNYASSIRYKNIFGVQFHPEKSHAWGVRLLKNFAEL